MNLVTNFSDVEKIVDAKIIADYRKVYFEDDTEHATEAEFQELMTTQIRALQTGFDVDAIAQTLMHMTAVSVQTFNNQETAERLSKRFNDLINEELQKPENESVTSVDVCTAALGLVTSLHLSTIQRATGEAPFGLKSDEEIKAEKEEKESPYLGDTSGFVRA